MNPQWLQCLESISKPQNMEQSSNKKYVGSSSWDQPLDAGDTAGTESGKITDLSNLHSLE
jgi:hypothetical protein